MGIPSSEALCRETTEQGCIWSVVSMETSPSCLLISHLTFVENFTTASSTYGKNPIKVEIKALILIAFIGSDQHQLEFSWSLVLQTNILRSFLLFLLYLQMIENVSS